MSKGKIITIVVVVLILLKGIITIKQTKKRDANAPLAKQYDVVVSTQKVEEDSTTVTLPYLAMVGNDKDVKIASKIPARVIFVKPSGSSVHRGEVIVRLDNTSIQSNIASVKAQLKSVNVALQNMEAAHKRTTELLDVQGASIEQSQKEESKLSELQAKKEALAGKLQELSNMNSYATITSPITGVISKTMVNRGDMAMPGHPIAMVKANNGYTLLVRVPSDMKIQGVELNKKHYDAIPLQSTFMGLAEYKAYVNDPTLKSGDRVEVDVELVNGKNILLPFDAVLNRDGKSYVLVREGNKAIPQEVSIVATGEQGIVISNSELLGKEVVVAKQDILLKLLSGVSLKVKGE